MQPSSAIGLDEPDGVSRVSDDPSVVAGQLGDLLRDLLLDPRADHLKAIEERNLSITHVRALFLLACADQPLSAGELADRLGLSPAAMSRSLQTLVRRRLTSRRESTSDRRVRLLEITARGEALVDELVTLRNAGLQRFAANLGAAQRQLLSEALVSLTGDGALR
ncbi:MAG: MarR family transcriptional regulator [Solirubrobacterales bacterium]